MAFHPPGMLVAYAVGAPLHAGAQGEEIHGHSAHFITLIVVRSLEGHGIHIIEIMPKGKGRIPFTGKYEILKIDFKEPPKKT